MGLFWSMIQTKFRGKRKGFRKMDTETPIVVDLSVHKGHLNSHTALQDDIPMASTQVHRWYKADNVERIHVRSGNVRGVIYKPKGMTRIIYFWEDAMLKILTHNMFSIHIDIHRVHGVHRYRGG